jgi:hypothetical protein
MPYVLSSCLADWRVAPLPHLALHQRLLPLSHGLALQISSASKKKRKNQSKSYWVVPFLVGRIGLGDHAAPPCCE